MDGIIKVFKASTKTYGVSEAGYWYQCGYKPRCVAGLLDSRSDSDTWALLKLMDRAVFLVDISDEEFRELLEGPGLLKDKSAKLYKRLSGGDADVC